MGVCIPTFNKPLQNYPTAKPNPRHTTQKNMLVYSPVYTDCRTPLFSQNITPPPAVRLTVMRASLQYAALHIALPLFVCLKPNANNASFLR